MEKQERSQMLGSMPMSRLIPKVSVPIMISMLVQALYNIVDSVFVAKYDPNALTAVSLAYPIQMLMIALSTGMGTGIGSLISRRLGEKRHDEAIDAARNGIFIELLGTVLFMIIGVFFSRTFMSMFTPDAALQELGTTYLTIVCTVSVGLFMSVVLERMMQATGNTTLSMLTQLVGAVINIILDPIMIFTMNMGIAGAAWATVIGQIGGMLLGLVLNQTRNTELKLSMKGFRPNKQILSNIFAVGLPSTVMSSIGSVLNVLMNLILIAYGTTAVSVMGVYYKLQSFVFMPVFGLSNGLVPVVGYNYGAKLRKRVYSAIRVALCYAGAIMLIGTVAFLLFPEALMSIFESGETSELTTMGAVALRTISLSFIPAAVGITLGTVFQAVGKGGYSLIMSVCRQLVVLLPCAWILSKVGGLDAIWWAWFIAEIASVTICLFMFAKCNRTLLKPLGEKQAE